MKWITFIALLISINCVAQNTPPKVGAPNTLNQWAGGISADSFARIAPVRSPNTNWYGRQSDFIRWNDTVFVWAMGEYRPLGLTSEVFDTTSIYSALSDTALSIRSTHGLQQATDVNNSTNRALNTTGATGVNAAGTALAHTPVGGALMYLGAAKVLMATSGTTIFGPGAPAMSILPGHTEFNSEVRASPAVAGSDVVIKDQLDSVAAVVQDSISAQDLQAVSEKGDTTTHRLTMNGLTVTDTAGTPATTTAAIQVVRTLGALPFSNARGFADYSIFQRPGASYNSYDAVVTFRGPGIGHYTGNQIRPDFDGASVGDYESYWTWAKLRNGSHVVRRNDIVLGAGEIDGTSTLDTSAAITIENNRIGTVKYALRSYDAAAKTFHAGNFRIGSSADPAFTLQVDGLSRFERIGLGTNPNSATGINNRLPMNGGGYGYLGYNQVTGPVLSGAMGAYYITEPSAGVYVPYIYGVHVDQPDPIASGASVGDNVAFRVGPGWIMGSNLNAAFSGNVPAGPNNFNLHIPGTAKNYIAAALGVGTADPLAKVDVAGNIKQDSIKSGVVVADANGFLVKGVAGVDYMPAGGDSATYVTHPALAAALSDSLSNYAALSLLGANNGIATLGPTGKIPNGQVPAIAISETFPVSSEAAQLALPAEQGDVAVRLDQSKSYILTNNDPSSIANWQELLAPTVANTDQVPEGSTNLYFTVARARQALSGGTGIGYSNSMGVITNTSPNLQSNLSLGTATGTTQPINNSDGTGVTLAAASGSAAGLMSAADKTKLDGISPGAEVNVNADWNATSGDAEILNKPTIPAAANNGTLNMSATNGLTGSATFTANQSGNCTFTIEPVYGTAANTVAQGNDSRIVNGQTAFTWGNHAAAGYALADSSRWQTTYRSDTARANVYTALAGKEPTITTLPVSKGGTGANTLTGYVKGNGTSAFTASATIPYSDITGTPSIPTVNDGTLTLNTGGLLTGSASFTANQSGNTTFTVTSPGYGTGAGTIAQGNDSRINNGQTAFSWGNHALAGYLTAETDPNLAAIESRIVRSRQNYYGNGNGLNIENAGAEHGFVYPDGGAGGVQGPFISAGQFNGSNGYMLQIVGAYDNDGKEFRIRTRNGDLSAWNPLRKIWTDVDFSKSDFVHNQDAFEQSASMRINGTIRVGTGAPATAAISVGGTPAGQGLDLSSNDQYLNGRVFQNTNNPFDNHMYFGYNSGSGSALHFYSDDIETATIKEDKVGIGTTSPTAKVNIAYSSGAELKLGESITGNTTLGIGLSAATNGYGIMQAVKADGSELGDIALNPAGGNVGIGTGSPAARLDVNGSFNVSGTGSIEALGVGTNTPAEALHVIGNIRQSTVSNGLLKANASGTFVVATPGVDFPDVRTGISTITGDGSTTSFTISHPLGATPTSASVTPANDLAGSYWHSKHGYVDRSATDATTITITFNTAPNVGEQLDFYWQIFR